MVKTINFPQIHPPKTLEHLKKRILQDCEDIEMNATSASRGAEFIIADIIFFLSQIGVDTSKV